MTTSPDASSARWLPWLLALGATASAIVAGWYLAPWVLDLPRPLSDAQRRALDEDRRLLTERADDAASTYARITPTLYALRPRTDLGPCPEPAVPLDTGSGPRFPGSVVQLGEPASGSALADELRAALLGLDPGTPRDSVTSARLLAAAHARATTRASEVILFATRLESPSDDALGWDEPGFTELPAVLEGTAFVLSASGVLCATPVAARSTEPARSLVSTMRGNVSEGGSGTSARTSLWRTVRAWAIEQATLAVERGPLSRTGP